MCGLCTVVSACGALEFPTPKLLSIMTHDQLINHYYLLCMYVVVASGLVYSCLVLSPLGSRV
jgi:hypothetical protein